MAGALVVKVDLHPVSLKSIIPAAGKTSCQDGLRGFASGAVGIEEQSNGAGVSMEALQRMEEHHV